MKRRLLPAIAALCAVSLLLGGCVLFRFGAGSWNFDNDTTLPTGFTSTGAYSWTVDTTTGNSGSHSLKSGSPYQGGSSYLNLAFDNLKSTSGITFAYFISGSSSDSLTLRVNGQLVWTGSGNGDVPVTWQHATVTSSFTVTSDSNTLEWEYYSNSSTPVGDNCARIDDVNITGG